MFEQPFFEDELYLCLFCGRNCVRRTSVLFPLAWFQSPCPRCQRVTKHLPLHDVMPGE